MSFSRRDQGAARLPRDVVPRMEQFGRFEFDPAGSELDGTVVWEVLQAPFLEFAQSEPDRFAAALAEAVLPAGGFALYGAARTVWNLLGSDFRHPAYDTVRLAALEFFRAAGVPKNRLTAGDWQFWRRHRGDTWLVGRPRPAREAVRIAPLVPGEVRRVAVLTAAPDSNVLSVRAAGGGFQLLVEARASDTDPTRSVFEWFGAPTLYDLYARLGETLQVPPYWAGADLAPFIPLPAPTL